MTIRFLMGSLVMVTIGCGAAKTVPPAAEVQATSASAAELKPEMVPRAEFVNWSRFPAGTAVTRVRTTTNQHGTVLVTTRTKLLEKAADRVVVESQIDVQRPNQALEKNDAMTHDYPAEFALPPGMTAEQFSLPSMKALRTSTEKIVVGDREYQADVYEWDDSSEAGPIKCKLWSSDTFPGRTLKQEQRSTGAGFTSEELVTEVDLAAESVEAASRQP